MRSLRYRRRRCTPPNCYTRYRDACGPSSHTTAAPGGQSIESLLATDFGDTDGRFCSEAIFSSSDFDVFDSLDRAGREGQALPDVLRVLSRSGNATWATACFTREPDSPGFTQIEVNYLSSVARYIGAGVREYLAQITWQPGHSVVPGVLVVDAAEHIGDATPDATEWLDRLGVEAGSALPPPLRGLVRQTREQRVGRAPLRPAKVRVRLPEGNWVVARAARFTVDQTKTAAQSQLTRPRCRLRAASAEDASGTGLLVQRRRRAAALPDLNTGSNKRSPVNNGVRGPLPNRGVAIKLETPQNRDTKDNHVHHDSVRHRRL
jgi:hypothetical protein